MQNNKVQRYNIIFYNAEPAERDTRETWYEIY